MQTAHPYTPRHNFGGNFCGHDPLHPRFTLEKPAKKGAGGLPRVLTLCMERITGYYNRPRKVLPSLDLANGSERQQRSERREACICVLASLLKYTDLASLRVGIPTSQGFLNLTVNYLARNTGMTLKRVERALADLKAAGLLTVSQPRQLTKDGSWRGLAAVKAVSKDLFAVFGLAVMLKKERDKASKRLKEKAQKWAEELAPKEPGNRTARARLSLFMGALADGVKKRPARKPAAPIDPNAVPPPDPEEHRRYILKVLELKGIHWDWSKEAIEQEAARQIAQDKSA